MSFGNPSWLAGCLLARTPYRGQASHVVGCVSVMRCFPTTSGPYRGMGACAPTYFQMTAVELPDRVLVFADQELMGWLPPAQVPPVEQMPQWLGKVRVLDLTCDEDGLED